MVKEWIVNSPDETNGTSQHEEAIKVANADDFVDFLLGEHAATCEKIEE